MGLAKGRKGLSQVLGHALRAAIVLAAAGAFCLAGQEQARLEVRATSPRTELLIWEPLVLDVEVRNVGQTDAMVREILSPSGFGLSVNVRTPDWSMLSYKDVLDLTIERVPIVTLAPGETYRHREVIVCFSSLSYVLHEVGYYSVEVSYSPDGRMESAVQAAPLRVVVREPQGLEGEALDLFQGRRQAQFMAGLGKERFVEEFERLATYYPTTVYGRYARFYLAKALIDPNRSRTESLYAKAARLLEGLLSEEQGFPLTDQCMLDLAECYEHTNRKDESRALLGKLLERFPESPVAVPAKKLDSLQPLTPAAQVPQQAAAKPAPEAAPQAKPAQPPAPAE